MLSATGSALLFGRAAKCHHHLMMDGSPDGRGMRGVFTRTAGLVKYTVTIPAPVNDHLEALEAFRLRFAPDSPTPTYVLVTTDNSADLEDQTHSPLVYFTATNGFGTGSDYVLTWIGWWHRQRGAPQLEPLALAQFARQYSSDWIPPGEVRSDLQAVFWRLGHSLDDDVQLQIEEGDCERVE